MALTDLLPIDDINKVKYTGFEPPANQAAGGPPASEIDSSLTMMGRRVDNNQVLIFSASTQANAEALISISSVDPAVLDLNVVDDNGAPSLITYWEVNVGFNLGKDGKWEQEVSASRSGRKKGKWVFVKSKKDDDDAKSKPGCLGFLMSFLP